MYQIECVSVYLLPAEDDMEDKQPIWTNRIGRKDRTVVLVRLQLNVQVVR